MEDEPSILESLLDDGEQDIEMLDVLEEGQLFEQTADKASGEDINNGGGDGGNLDTAMNPGKKKRKKNRKNKKKNKLQQPNGPAHPVEINRFVIDTCRRLKEKKSYLVYSAVGTLGVEALSNLLREVEAIQSRGGQMTADGKRYRTGGGILWNILKEKERDAYREIMKQAKEFEKQLFRRPKMMMMRSAGAETADGLSNETASTIAAEDEIPTKLGELVVPESQRLVKDNGETKRSSVHDRIRVPVSYADLIEDEPKDSCS